MLLNVRFGTSLVPRTCYAAVKVDVMKEPQRQQTERVGPNGDDGDGAGQARMFVEDALSAEAARNEAEQFRRLAEEAREARDGHREALETIRQERERLRETAETARAAAEGARTASEEARVATEDAHQAVVDRYAPPPTP